MKIIARLLLVAGVVLGTYALCYWPVIILTSPVIEEQPALLDVVPKFLCSVLALVAGWRIWLRLKSADLGWVAFVFIGAVLLGGIGFAVGFYGPTIWSPENNLGPLLGIFLTGPLSAIVGGGVGFVYYRMRRA